jgi:hypothetical protein
LDTDARSRHLTPLERRHMWSTRAFKAVLAFAVLDAFAGWLRPDTLPPHPYDVVSTIALAVVISLTFFAAQSTRLRLDSKERSGELAKVGAEQVETRAEVSALRAEARFRWDTITAEQEQRDSQIYAALARVEMASRDWRDGDTVEFCRPVLVPDPRPAAPIRAVAAVAVRPVRVEATVTKRKRRRGVQDIPRQRQETPPADPVPEAYLKDMSKAVELGKKLAEAEEEERRRRGTA